MLNPSVNHRSVTQRAALLIAAVAIGVTLPLAAMRAPAEPERTVRPAVPGAAIEVPRAAAPVEGAPAPIVPRAAARKSALPRPVPPAPRQGRADGSLAGTVFDGSGAVVPGVTLTVYSIEVVTGFGVRENPVATTISGEVGTFEFRALAAGPYSLKAELRGFASFQKRFEIKPGQTVRENIFMSVGNVVSSTVVIASGSPKPPVVPQTPQRIRVGGNVIAPNLISQVKPVYPEKARDAGIEGTVHLRGIIGVEGAFITLRVVSSSDVDLANAAFEAVRQWRYRPALLNNQPIEVSTEIDVEFKLAQ